MTPRTPLRHSFRPLVLAALLVCALLVLPTATTGAFLTDSSPAPAAAGGTGKWCSVPNHQLKPNVYRLRDFEAADYPGNPTTRMLAVPVVHNGDYAPTAAVPGVTAGSGTLGVRLWACNPASLGTTSAPSLKITSWRRSTADTQPVSWKAAATSPLSPQYANTLAAQRLDLGSGWGRRLQQLHRLGGGSSNDNVSGSVRAQYGWLLEHGRTKTNPAAAPSCTTNACSFSSGDAPSWPNAFQPDSGATRDYTNSVTYLGGKFWTGTGVWPSRGAPTASALQLSPYSPTRAEAAANTNGQQVQWVTMEWWTTAPATYDDVVVEVFVA